MLWAKSMSILLSAVPGHQGIYFNKVHLFAHIGCSILPDGRLTHPIVKNLFIYYFYTLVLQRSLEWLGWCLNYKESWFFLVIRIKGQKDTNFKYFYLSTEGGIQFFCQYVTIQISTCFSISVQQFFNLNITDYANLFTYKCLTYMGCKPVQSDKMGFSSQRTFQKQH